MDDLALTRPTPYPSRKHAPAQQADTSSVSPGKTLTPHPWRPSTTRSRVFSRRVTPTIDIGPRPSVSSTAPAVLDDGSSDPLAASEADSQAPLDVDDVAQSSVEARSEKMTESLNPEAQLGPADGSDRETPIEVGHKALTDGTIDGPMSVSTDDEVIQMFSASSISPRRVGQVLEMIM